MNRIIVIGIIVILVGVNVSGDIDTKESSTIAFDGNILYVGGSGPNNYTTIQSAIDDTFDGDTVFVYSGTYFEILYIDKPINLIGENKETTIIDGFKGDNVIVAESGVTISSFTVKNSGNVTRDMAGIKIFSNVNITGNIICLNNIGIYCKGTNISIQDNIISNNQEGGITTDIQIGQ